MFTNIIKIFDIIPFNNNYLVKQKFRGLNSQFKNIITFQNVNSMSFF